MLDKPRVFNIPANYHFFESLFYWLEKNFSNQLSQTKLFLPNRRSCREFSQLILSKQNTAFLPKIKAISDISFEDFFDFLPNEEAKKIIDEVLQIKAISGIDYLFFLSKEIQNLSVFGDNLEFGQAFKIAVNLQNLFEDIEREEITLSKLDKVDDSNLSKHRQLTLDFLKNFYIQIKNSLLKKNIFLQSSSQNFIIQRFTYLLEKFGSKTPIILAGSTGSISFSKKLIKAIAQKNYVILHGVAEENYEIESHPQFFLNRLINFLEIDKSQLQKIDQESFLLSDESRQKLISLTMLPKEQAEIWQKADSILNVKKIVRDLQENFQLIEAKNEIEEAKIIALILQETRQNKKTAALISNNDKLASFVALELTRLNLSFNDTRNLSIFNSQLVNFLLLILELIESNFNSYTLLAVLKNPLCAYSKSSTILNDFEIQVLRQDRANFDLSGIRKKLKILKDKNLSNFFEEFYAKLLIEDDLEFTLANQALKTIKIIENLSQKTWQKLLEDEPAQIEIFEFFEKIKLQNDIAISSKNVVATFKTLLSQISYFKKSQGNASIQILSSVEARLLNYDLVIIASLNEGDFPTIETENWLGKKIKKDLEIDQTAKKIGQNAFDFCNYLSNKSVVLTRCKTRNDVVLLESPFLLKFKILCQKIEIDLNRGEKYFSLLKETNSASSKKIELANAKPEKDLRPKKFSITEISKLISNPYSIYAKKILQLKKLEKIDFENSYAEFGSFVHKALEEFIKNPQQNFIKNSAEIFEKYFLSDEAKLIWWPKFENIFADFVKENEKFLHSKNYVEVAAELNLGDILISGKIDRMSENDDGLVEIFDYKTGQVPGKKEVESGINPQLTLAALMLVEGIIENGIKNFSENEISTISYWKLSSSRGNEIKKICDNNEEIKILIAAAKSGLKNLFEYFADEQNGYLANDDEKSEYRHLARSQI